MGKHIRGEVYMHMQCTGVVVRCMYRAQLRSQRNGDGEERNGANWRFGGTFRAASTQCKVGKTVHAGSSVTCVVDTVVLGLEVGDDVPVVDWDVVPELVTVVLGDVVSVRDTVDVGVVVGDDVRVDVPVDVAELVGVDVALVLRDVVPVVDGDDVWVDVYVEVTEVVAVLVTVLVAVELGDVVAVVDGVDVMVVVGVELGELV